jgi:hypothetical protein
MTMTAALAALTLGAGAHAQAVHWTRNGAPVETYITGGPWTLEQSGAALGLKSAGYCDGSGNQVPNPANERMEPYYFPFITGRGEHLQGYFDYRPKDTDEAVVAANSNDGGRTWNFQQEVLQLRTACPTVANKEPDGETDAVSGNNADNGDDDGQGHQFVLTIAGHTYLYTLERANNHIDVDDLYIHEIAPLPGKPLNGAPAMDDGPTDATSTLPKDSGAPMHTVGLLNPDGILGVVPGSWPVRIIYEQKILNGDKTWPAAQQCTSGANDASGPWAGYYASNPYGTATNHDVTYLRLAETTDGVHFKDDGALTGLNNPADVTAYGTRWLATAGTILKLEDGRYGLLYSGGGCIDGDSDAFRYIGYAESKDLLSWTVVNGLENPLLIASPYTIKVDGTGVPSSTGTSITVPHVPAVGGVTSGFFAGRVYAPSATIWSRHDLTVTFAGYHTPKPKNGLGDYRTISRISLHSDEPILDASTNVGGNRDEDDQD